MLIPLGGRRSSENEIQYDISYTVNEDTLDLTLFKISYGEDRTFFEEFPLMHFDGTKRTFGKGMDILENNIGKGHMFKGLQFRVGLLMQEVLRRENDYAHKMLFKMESETDRHEPKIGQSCFGPYADESMFAVINFLRIDGNTFEKLFKSLGEDFIYSNISKRLISVNSDGSKMNQVLGIPKQIIQQVKEKYPNQITAFQKICSILDGNDAIYLLNFLEEMYGVGGENVNYLSCLNTFRQIVDLVAEIEDYRKTPMPTLLTYIMRQLYYGYSHTHNSFRNVNGFKHTAQVLRDVLSMYGNMTGCVMSDLPSDLFYEHQVIAANYNATRCNESVMTQFNDAVTKYESLNFFGDKYLIRAPKSVTELVAEGTILRHCVASYKDRIAQGESIVMFLRKQDAPDVPFVTVEYDEEYGITQIKGFLDQDVSDSEVLAFAHEWEKGVEDGQKVQ